MEGQISATQSPYSSKRCFAGNLSESDDEEGEEEEGWCGSAPCRKEACLTPTTAAAGSAAVAAACREHLRSACVHFPHLELMFLFFAFEGAVASQARAIGDGHDEKPIVFCMAVVALVRVHPLCSYVHGGEKTMRDREPFF